MSFIPQSQNLAKQKFPEFNLKLFVYHLPLGENVHIQLLK